MKRIFTYVLTFILLLASVEAYAANYRSELRKVTRMGRVFSLKDFSAALIMHATLFTPEYRRAYEEKVTGLEQFDAVEAAKFIAETEKRKENGIEFFIGVYSKPSYSKFSDDETSFWKAEITTESGEVVPAKSIEEIQVSPLVERLYPYLNRWSKGYRLYFPHAVLGKNFEMKVHSVVGETILKWKLKDSYDGR